MTIAIVRSCRAEILYEMILDESIVSRAASCIFAGRVDGIDY
jgi:hypothetical protein